MRKSLRYSVEFEPQLGIEVIGYHCPIRAEVAAPDGVPAYRIMMFHRKSTVRLGAEVYHWPAHTLVMIPPGVPSFYGETGHSISHSWIRASGDRLPQLLREFQLEANHPVYFPDAQENDRWLSDLIRESQNPQTRFEIVHSLVRIWLATIQRHSDPERTVSIPRGLLKAREAIEETYLDKHSLAEYARIAGYSPAHFCVRYKEAYGTSPTQHVVRLRIDHARDLLENVNLSVADIAEMSSFCDLYYFSRVFKQHTGMSPRQFRDCNRQAGVASRASSSRRKPGHDGKTRPPHSR